MTLRREVNLLVEQLKQQQRGILLRQLIFLIKQRQFQLRPHKSPNDVASWWINSRGEWDGQRHLIDDRNLGYTYCGIPVTTTYPGIIFYKPHQGYAAIGRFKPLGLPSHHCSVCYANDLAEIPL